MTFGNTAGNVGQQGSNRGKVVVGTQVNKAQQHVHTENVAVGNQVNKGQKMTFGNTAASIGQQGANMGNVKSIKSIKYFILEMSPSVDKAIKEIRSPLVKLLASLVNRESTLEM